MHISNVSNLFHFSICLQYISRFGRVAKCISVMKRFQIELQPTPYVFHMESYHVRCHTAHRHVVSVMSFPLSLSKDGNVTTHTFSTCQYVSKFSHLFSPENKWARLNTFLCVQLYITQLHRYFRDKSRSWNHTENIVLPLLSLNSACSS